MKNIYKILAIPALALATIAQPAMAQYKLRSSYFLEGSSYRHQLNPAFAPERAYVSIPVLGNLSLGLQSTIGVSNFIYKTPDGQLTTFMNSSVDAKEFLGDLKNRNRINETIDMTILSVGFRGFGGFNTITLDMHQKISMNVPKDLFAFMKEGMSSAHTVYEFDNLGMSLKAYAELGLGHTHRVNEDWVVGGKLKFLFGAGDASLKINHMRMTMGEDQWAIEGDGELNASVAGLSIPTKAESGKGNEDEADQINWDDIDFGSPGLGGFGVAIDLGATWKVREDLELSAAILDLGFIKWKNTIKGKMGMTPWSFNGFHNIPINPEEGEQNQYELEDQLEDLGDQLEDCVNFKKTAESEPRATALGATLNLGALYTLPYYKNLKFGFLSSTYINGAYSWSEGRFSANIAPVKCFDASISYAVSSFGSSFGWVINLHPRGFNLFLGSNHQFFKITPQFVPVHHATADINIGINIPFGKRKTL